MTNIMCIIKCNKCLSNKPSSDIIPKHKIINFQTQVLPHIQAHLGNQKAFLPHKNTGIANIEIQLLFWTLSSFSVSLYKHSCYDQR